MIKKSYRYLQGYTLDPGYSSQLDSISFNQTIYRIRWEDMIPPTNRNAKQHINGEYFEVIDIDPSSNCYYEPLNLNSIEVLSQNGLPPSEGNPQFHQQFVYTIAMKTLDSFEKALGRKIIWSIRKGIDGKREYVDKIRLYPHALREANAYYDSSKKALLFGYFKSSPKLNGVSFPGGAVFTCLSPDIIAHEVTHALLDSVHPRFMENTNHDVPAFHEAFADIIALLQRFTMNELIEAQLRSTRGNLNEFNVLGELATQFGNALPYGHGALRSAIGTRNENGKWIRKTPDPTLYQTVFEPHDRGSLLVAAFFDALIKVYTFKTQDLIRIASNGTGILPNGMISHDLTKRLAQELSQIAQHMLNIAIRALDYCPPVDINFGDYLRALITADLDAAPADDNNYRVALMDSFRSWGIFPDLVNTFSVESLQWFKPSSFDKNEEAALKKIAKSVEQDVRYILSLSDRKKIFEAYNDGQSELHKFLMSKQDILGPDKWDKFLKKLGLSSNTITYKDEMGNDRKQENNMKLEVHKIRPVYRMGREGNILEQVIVTLTQKANVSIGEGESNDFIFRGGCTLIFNLANNFSLDYIITKNIASQRRFLAQWNYQQGRSEASNFSFHDSIYQDDNCSRRIDFARLHFYNTI